MGRILLGLIAGLLMVACTKGPEELILKADLSAEHDEGRFTPEAGDRLSLAADFTGWEPGHLYFTDEDGDWIYEARISKEQIPTDTLRFKLVITSEQNRDLPNSGWEVIPNRQIDKEILQQEQPVFTFNEIWSPGETLAIDFAVSMSNQQVLGFFDPETDKVVVSGSFMENDPTGIELSDPDGDLIYEASVPVRYHADKPLTYRYRIVKGNTYEPAGLSAGALAQARYLPHQGWEYMDTRVWIKEQPRSPAEVDYFNGQQRVARFMISEGWLRDSAKVNLNKGDLLQICLSYTEKEFVSDPLVKTKEGFYETSIELPLNVLKVEWDILKNFEPIKEGIKQALFLDQKGKRIML